jgi:hypothetical protein
MTRRLLALLVAGLVFLAASLLVARVLSANGAERSAVVDLVELEARGNAAELLERLPACRPDPACSRRVRALADRLRRPGPVRILRYDPAARFVLGTDHGVARVAWAGADGRPVIQCVPVRRRVRILAGTSITLRRPSGPLDAEATC